jgi:lysophospholipase L1-like esterase
VTRRRLLTALSVLPALCGGRVVAAGRGLNLIFDGDSISAGAGSSQGHALDVTVVAGLDVPLRLNNVAASGRPVLNCLRFYGQRVAPLFSPEFRANVIVFHAGDNDINQGRDAAHTYAAFTDYVEAAHRQGWKVVVSTELRRFDFPPPKQAYLEDYNARLRQNRAHADAVVDLDAEARFVAPEERHDTDVFSPDGVHPSDGGYAIIADMLVSAIKRVSSTR